MNKFCVVRYSTVAQRAEIIERILKYADDEMPFHIGRRHIREYREHNLILYSAEAHTTPFEDADYVFTSQHAFLSFDGAPVFRGQNPNSPWAERLYRHFRRQSVGGFFTSTLGDYGLVALNDGIVTGLSDFVGNKPLFTYQREGIIAISNRQRLLHRLLNENGRIDLDPLALSWLVDQGNIFDVQSPYAGVKLVVPGRYVQIGPEGLRSGGFRRFYSHPQRKDEPTREEIDRAVAALFEQASLTGELPFRLLQMDLTGGMDSRATLAIAIGSGLIDRVSTIKTMGPPNAPDIQVAQHIAEELGLPFEAVISKPPANPEQPSNIDALWRRLRLNNHALDGTIMVGDGLPGVYPTTTLCMTGGAGEIYRPHMKSRNSRVIKDLKSAKTIYQSYHFQSNPHNFLKPDAARSHRAYFHQRIDVLHKQGVPFEDMHFVFYAEGRMPWWNGYMMSNVMGRSRLNPLANFEAASIMFSVAPEQKKINRLHFELMKAADPRLIELPFLSNKWDDKILQYADGLPIAREPMKTIKPDSIRSKKPWLFELAEARWDQVFSTILDSPKSVLFDALDRAKIEEMSHRPEVLAGGNVRFILTLAQIAMLEQGDWEIVKQGQRPKNIVEFGISNSENI